MKGHLNIGCGTEVGDQYQLDILGLVIKLPLFQKIDYLEGMWRSWGLVYFDRGIHFNWGSKTKIINMPWDRGACVYSKVKDFEGGWIEDEGKDYNSKGTFLPFKDDRYHETFPYQYRLKNGEVQKIKARIHTNKMVWWWRIFHFLPFWMNLIVPFKTTRISIGVEFDSEVGERSGSWKGGTMGCGYSLRNKETPYQCLRRMEQERLF